MRPYRWSALLLPALLALSGCHNGSSGSGTTGGTDNVGTTVEATVNGQTLSQQTFFAQLQSYHPQNITQARQPAGQVVLTELINNMLVSQYAQRQGVAPSSDMVNAIYNTQKASADSQNVKGYDQLLQEQGLTPDDVKQYQITPQLSTVDLIEKGQTPISDAAVSAYYAKNIAQFTEPNRAHIKRIVVTNPDTAQRIYDQIQQGQSFDSLVSQSLDHSFPGGDVPVWVSLDGPLNPNILPTGMLPDLKTAAAAEAKSGPGAASVTKPFHFRNLYVIAQVVATEPKTVIPLSEVSDYIRLTLMAQQAGQNKAGQVSLQQGLAQFRASSSISIPDPRYADLLTQLTAPPPAVPAAPMPQSPTNAPSGKTP